MQPRSTLGQPLAVLLIAIAAYVFWQMRQLILLVFAAIVLAQALHLQARSFERLGVQSRWARSFSIAVLLVFTVVFVGLIVPPVAAQIQQLIRVLPQGLTELELWLRQASEQVSFIELEDIDLSQIIESFQPVLMEILARPVMFVSVPLAVALNLLIVLVLALMLWANPAAYRNVLICLFPKFYRPRAVQILSQSEATLSRWLTAVVLQMITVAVLSGLGLWILGVRFALALGILSGLLTFIPYLGPTISVIPPFLTSLENPGTAIAVLMLYGLIHWVIIHHGLSKWIQRSTQILPGVALLIEILFARLFGISGLILAFPFALVAQVWIHSTLVEDVLNPWRDRTFTTSEDPNPSLLTPHSSLPSPIPDSTEPPDPSVP